MSGYLSLEGLQHFWSKVKSYISSHVVPVTRTVNGKALNQDISLGYSDVGAASSSTVSSLQTTVNTLQTKVESGGLAYSETEHVVGTWVDGSTIYEKTFSSNINKSSSSTGVWTEIIASGLTYINKVVDICGYMYPSNIKIPNYTNFSNVTVSIPSPTVDAVFSENYLIILAYSMPNETSVPSFYGDVYVTLRYTKK